MSRLIDSSGDTFFRVSVTPSGAVEVLQTIDGQPSRVTVSGDDVVPDGQACTVEVEGDGQVTIITVDGVSRGASTQALGEGVLSGPLRVGHDSSQHFPGAVAQVDIYDQRLNITQAQVARAALAQDWRDFDGVVINIDCSDDSSGTVINGSQWAQVANLGTLGGELAPISPSSPPFLTAVRGKFAMMCLNEDLDDGMVLDGVDPADLSFLHNGSVDWQITLAVRFHERPVSVFRDLIRAQGPVGFGTRIAQQANGALYAEVRDTNFTPPFSLTSSDLNVRENRELVLELKFFAGDPASLELWANGNLVGSASRTMTFNQSEQTEPLKIADDEETYADVCQMLVEIGHTSRYHQFFNKWFGSLGFFPVNSDGFFPVNSEGFFPLRF